VQELLDDIDKCRSNKLNSGLKVVLDSATREMVPHALQVDNISAMEVNMLRAGVFKVGATSMCLLPPCSRHVCMPRCIHRPSTTSLRWETRR
jgi:hypothetical protein